MELKIPSPEQLERAYETHLRVSFPAAELKPFRAIEEMWRDGWYRPWCLFDGDEMVGEGLLWLGHPGWVLLDYLCVAPEHRNAGYGSVIIEKLLERESNAVMLAESEIPELAPDVALATRRLNFYARSHAKTAGYDTEMFGVPYKTLYWSAQPVSDERLMREHQFIYQNRFSPEKFAHYVRIPRQPDAPPMQKVPWNE